MDVAIFILHYLESMLIYQFNRPILALHNLKAILIIKLNLTVFSLSHLITSLVILLAIFEVISVFVLYTELSHKHLYFIAVLIVLGVSTVVVDFHSETVLVKSFHLSLLIRFQQIPMPVELLFYPFLCWLWWFVFL